MVRRLNESVWWKHVEEVTTNNDSSEELKNRELKLKHTVQQTLHNSAVKVQHIFIFSLLSWMQNCEHEALQRVNTYNKTDWRLRFYWKFGYSSINLNKDWQKKRVEITKSNNKNKSANYRAQQNVRIWTSPSCNYTVTCCSDGHILRGSVAMNDNIWQHVSSHNGDLTMTWWHVHNQNPYFHNISPTAIFPQNSVLGWIFPLTGDEANLS